MRNARSCILSAALWLFLIQTSCSKSGGSPSSGGGATNPPTNPKQPAPSISAISPDSAAAGVTVNITGTNFDTTAIKDTVLFNGVAATVTKASATQLTVTVPTAGTSGKVTVKTAGGTSVGVAFTYITVPKSTVYVIGSDTRYGLGFWTNSTFSPLNDATSLYDLKGSGSDLYIAGPCSSNTPTYWKNGTAVHLSAQTGFTYSIVVSGTDVYNLGYMNNAFYVWKNGAPTQLSTTSLITTSNVGYYRSNCLFVYNGDSYVAGSQSLGNSAVSKATYWKNGVPTDLTDGINTGSAWATAVTVVGGDVYVAGIEQIADANHGITDRKPRLWKNGVSVPVTTTISSLYNDISGILVKGSDVYLGGQYNGAGAVWKNGSLIDSANYAVAEHVSSLFLYNNTDLYFSGASSVWGQNGYWINGNFVEMDPGCHLLSNNCANTASSQASAIYVK